MGNIKLLIEEIINNHPNCSALEFVYEDINYNKIIECGEKANKILLEKLEENYCAFWFNALENINNIKFFGNTSEKRGLWRNWGVKNEHKNYNKII